MTPVSPDGAAAPLVSIVSAYYNRGGHVADSIGSLLTQTYADLEVIVVDDGSTDDTAAALHAIADPRLRVISRENRGFTASMNEGIAASRGAYVAVHGSGDLSLPDRIARQAAVLNERLDVGVVGCWVENDEDDADGTRLFQPPDGLPFHTTLLKRGLFTHGEVMFRRSLFDAVGGYREFFRFAQDRDLWLRISRLAEYAIVPEVLYRRMKFAGGVSRSNEKLVLQYYLSEFALHCAREVDAGRPDPVERHGHLAGFLRERPPELARKMAWTGVKFMLGGDMERGWELVERARAERLTRPVATIYALAAMHRNPLIWSRVARPILSRRLAAFRM